MSLTPTAHRLCWHGLALFLAGLLAGVAVPAFANPRMGLSVHLAGVQSGMALAILGLLWRHVALSAAAERWVALGNVLSMWAIWGALLLAAMFGTSRTTPMAGAGHQGSAWQELAVAVPLYAGCLGLLVAWGAVLRGFRAPAQG